MIHKEPMIPSGNSYSDTDNAPKCAQCEEGSWSNKDKTSCSSDTTSLHLINHRYGSIVLAVVLVSLLIVIATFGNFTFGNFFSYTHFCALLGGIPIV